MLEILLGADNYPSFINNATVTRLDLAVDISPLTPDQIWPMESRLRKAKQLFSSSGELISIVLGDVRANRHIAIYNRHDEDEDESTDDPLTTRFEARLRRLGPLNELNSIANPFRSLTVYMASNEDPTEITDTQRLFLDSVRTHGAHAALRRIHRYETRKRYSDFLYQNFHHGPWFPERKWEEYPDALEHLAVPVIAPHRTRLRRRRRH